MLKIGVLVSGGGTNLQAIIDGISNGFLDAEIALVISSKKSAYALERAKSNGIECIYVNRKKYETQYEYDMELVERFNEKNVGLVVTAGFLIILGSAFINEFKTRMMNIHPSLIPAFCGKGFYGLKVHEAVLESGVKVTGATVHFADEGTDSGPIILQKAVPVFDDDTAEVLQKRVMEQGEQVILPEAIKLYSQGRLVIEGNKVRIKE